MPKAMLPEQYSRHTENIAGYPVTITCYRLWDTYYAKAEIDLPGMGGWFARAEGSTQAGAEAVLLSDVQRLLFRAG